MSGLRAGHVWPWGWTCLARVSEIRLGGRTSSWIGPTGVQYRYNRCDRFQHTLGIWFPYITHGNYLGFEHFSFGPYHHVASLFVVRWPILNREVKHIRINLSLPTWFFFVSFSSLSKLEGINMILTWAALPWVDNNGSSHYMIKTSLLIHVTSFLWFNRDWHLELCDSPWLIWYLGFKHPLALLHHIWYLNAKTPACSSPMYGSS
jgi:hypothetical protein